MGQEGSHQHLPLLQCKVKQVNKEHRQHKEEGKRKEGEKGQEEKCKEERAPTSSPGGTVHPEAALSQ